MLVARPLDREDIHAAARVTARAFRNNPAMVAILQRTEAQRQHLLEVFGRTLFSIYQKQGNCYVACDGGEICAAMMTLPWQKTPLPWTSELNIGMTSLRVGGLSTTSRFAKIDRFVKTRHPSQPHHYLYMLATDPEHQRRGYGSLLLDHLAQELNDHEIYLETDEPDNLLFYQKNGFEVLGDAPSPIGASPFPIWFLSRPAGSSKKRAEPPL